MVHNFIVRFFERLLFMNYSQQGYSLGVMFRFNSTSKFVAIVIFQFLTEGRSSNPSCSLVIIKRHVFVAKEVLRSLSSNLISLPTWRPKILAKSITHNCRNGNFYEDAWRETEIVLQKFRKHAACRESLSWILKMTPAQEVVRRPDATIDIRPQRVFRLKSCHILSNSNFRLSTCTSKLSRVLIKQRKFSTTRG